MALYTWGLGSNGQLGTGNLETKHTPQNIKPPGKVKQVDCGALFTVVLTEDGAVYSTGCGKFGRLGHGSSEKDSNILGPVVLSVKCSQVSCGSWHVGVVTTEGALFLWGYQKAFVKVLKPENMGLPNLFALPHKAKVAGVSCGHNYTYAWTVEGQLYSWGRGQNGVLGLGSDDDQRLPQHVETLKEEKVATVGAGNSHCGIVTESGLLYMTGKGSDGALGFGHSHLGNALLPKRCETGTEVKAVSCSKGEHHGHTLALTVSGSVLAWGDGYKGKLGLGGQESRYTPAVIPPELFNNQPVTSISAGGIHSAAATASGEVFTWGCGSDGRLGHPEGQGHRYLFRSDIPKKVEGLPKAGAGKVTVSCAYYHCAAVVHNSD
ncbi:ultraviolet-B receptor UVR8 [Aplysia californica]|uniref:Ultraviolet-B receptor UVR8 n=1 Tax=Aplysia californica TaxID=6500 RepID=A0ABM0JIV3_APLCA|nr:ultraviolet-B receptor UVR8 [Aplysia californica]XP_005094678.1 ultraviolet-B receptor UVR8 [Aplysia californica]